MNKATILACALVSLLVAGGSATAASLITSSDIKNGTIKSEDIKDGYVKSSDIKNGAIKNEDIKKTAITMDRFSKSTQNKINKAGTPGAAGATGAQGPAGPQGLKGDKGDAGPTLSLRNWGVQNRNTIGSPSAFLRSGPSTPAVGAIPAQAPPFGTGSLNLLVWGGPTVPADEREGGVWQRGRLRRRSFQDLTAVGFRLYTTGENIDAGGTTPICRRSPSRWIPIEQGLTTTSHRSSSSPRRSFPCSGAITSTPRLLACGEARAAVHRHAMRHQRHALQFHRAAALLNDGGDPAIIARWRCRRGGTLMAGRRRRPAHQRHRLRLRGDRRLRAARACGTCPTLPAHRSRRRDR